MSLHQRDSQIVLELGRAFSFSTIARALAIAALADNVTSIAPRCENARKKKREIFTQGEGTSERILCVKLSDGKIYTLCCSSREREPQEFGQGFVLFFSEIVKRRNPLRSRDGHAQDGQRLLRRERRRPDSRRVLQPVVARSCVNSRSSRFIRVRKCVGACVRHPGRLMRSDTTTYSSLPPRHSHSLFLSLSLRLSSVTYALRRRVATNERDGTRGCAPAERQPPEVRSALPPRRRSLSLSIYRACTYIFARRASCDYRMTTDWNFFLADTDFQRKRNFPTINVFFSAFFLSLFFSCFLT